MNKETNYLKKLGWCDFFENQIQERELEYQKIGRIITEYKNSYIVEAGKKYRATLRGKFLKKTEFKKILPVVGDFVLITETSEDQAVIDKILDRKNEIKRKAPDNIKRFRYSLKEQTLAANIDVAFIVTSLNENFNVNRIQRYLTLIYNANVKPIILLSKSDLTNNPDEQIKKVQTAVENVEIIAFSNETKAGIDKIKKYLKEGITACLFGSSGVGKSTLINSLIPDANQKTLDIREKDGRGKHTTVNRTMFFTKDGGTIIDTPGLREVALLEDDTGLKTAFDKIEEIAKNCEFKDCMHESEPNCAVKDSLEKGIIDKKTLENYKKIKKEIQKNKKNKWRK